MFCLHLYTLSHQTLHGESILAVCMHDRTILIFISLILMERTFFRAAATSKANGKKLEKVPEEMEVEENIQEEDEEEDEEEEDEGVDEEEEDEGVDEEEE